MISDRSRGGTFRACAAFGVLLALTLGLGVALRALGDAAKRDFVHDVAWYRYGAPLALRRQADRWYPWSAPLLEHWTDSSDPVRVAYAESTYARLGGWPARRWLEREVARNPVLDQGADALFAEPTWRAAFGLDDAARRRAIIVAAQRQRPPALFEPTFDGELLRQLNVSAAPAPAPSAAAPTPAPPLVVAATRHANGDHRADAQLRAALDAPDLHAVGAIDDFYVELKLAEDFPGTRYVRAMKAYDAIRGGTYFGGDREGARGDEKAWRGWLRAYSDHPGADDATYWLVRALEVQGRRVDALGVLTDALMAPLGDGDMYGQLWSRFLYLLDVGTKDADLDTWLTAHHGDPLEPLVAYARGVRYARLHQFGKAVEASVAFTKGVRAATARMKALGRALPFDPDHVIAAVEAQTALWRHLSAWVIYTVNDLHPELRELVIQEWTKPNGWTIPYLALYDGMRGGGGGPDVPGAMDVNDLADNYRHASALATALALTMQNLGDPVSGPWTRERDLYRVVALLYAQATQYPDNETLAMHPLPGLPAGTGDDRALYDPPRDPNAPKPGDPYFDEYARNANVQAWYVRQAVAATRALIAAFPNSAFADSALMCVYEMSGERKYLEELLQRYPDGDRAEEARAALYIATHPAPSH